MESYFLYFLKTILIQTSPKGFSASKCDVGNWIFSKLGTFLEIVRKFFGFLRDFFEELLGFFLDFFWKYFLGGFFLEDFFGGFFCLYCQLTYLNLRGIDGFVKILFQ